MAGGLIIPGQQLRVPTLQGPQVQRTDVSSGLQAAADAALEIETRIDNARNATMMNDATTGSAQEFRDLDEKVRQLPYDQKTQAYEDGAKQIRANHLDSLPGHLKQSFTPDFERMYGSYQIHTRDDAWKGMVDHSVAQAGEASDGFARDIAFARTPQERDVAKIGLTKTWMNLVAGGQIDELQARNQIEKGLGSGELYTARQMVESNPQRFMQAAKDPTNFKFLSLEQLSALHNEADVRIRQQQSEARANAAAQSEGVASGAMVAINRFGNGQGDFTQSDVDGLKGKLKVDTVNRLQIMFDDARARREGADAGRAGVADLIQSGGHIDPGSKAQKDGYDAFFRQNFLPGIVANAQSLPADERAASIDAQVLNFVGSQKVVPETLIASTRTALRSGSPAEKMGATRLIEQLKAIDPQIGNDFSEEDTRLGSMIAANVDRGMMPDAAVRAAEELMRTPKATREVLEKVYNDKTKVRGLDGTTAQERWLRSEFSDWSHWTSSVTVLPSVAADADEVVRSEFVRNGGDLDAARKVALDTMKARYGVSEVNGGADIMRNPPEQHYALPWLTPGETAKVIRDEAVDDIAKDALIDPLNPISPSTVRLLPYPIRGKVSPDGKPTYALQVKDSAGNWHTQINGQTGVPLPWYPTLDKARAERDAKVNAAIAIARGNAPAGAEVVGEDVFQIFPDGGRRKIGVMNKGKFVQTRAIP